jgi:hypothetical protein
MVNYKRTEKDLLDTTLGFPAMVAGRIKRNLPAYADWAKTAVEGGKKVVGEVVEDVKRRFKR